ncbi:MAG: NADH-quinone oxidoreductase subunit M [Chloroflexaceae bacterium]|jgi:NADH-quinone oxidoreductase subunit M|nr:NADH-quinone oxidoreductase subunit M [Chloroflexaceae bacterium]
MTLPGYMIAAPDGLPWLTLLVLSPLLGALLVALGAALRLDDRMVKWGVAAWMLVPLALALRVWAGFDSAAVSGGQGAVQFVERLPWVQAIQVNYFLGVDGISLPLVLLTVVMAPIAALASFGISERVKLHFALLLLLQTAMLGYFLALDFFFWFIFWEISLVPAFFLIQHWGRENSRVAAFKFFVYTVAGSLGLLLVFQFIYLATRFAGVPTWDLINLGRLGQGLALEGAPAGLNLQRMLFDYADHLGIANVVGRFEGLYASIAFWAIFVAFAIKLAVWPFHTWLPDAYSEAPTAASILLSAVMSKMGAYGMLRIMLPLVPEASQFFAPAMGALALIGIVAGAFGAFSHVRGDVKRLIAYTSINHMGYVMLAIAAAAAAGTGAVSADSRAIALNGALVQMVAHGLSTGALFLLAGALYARTQSYNLRDFGGLRAVMPGFAGVMGVAMFANLGLPGLAGFVGEFFIFRGAWATLPFFTLLATIGLVFTALALLLMFQQIFLGPLNGKWKRVNDISPFEFWTAAPLLLLLLVFGLYPAPLMSIANTAATQMVAVFR